VVHVEGVLILKVDVEIGPLRPKDDDDVLALLVLVLTGVEVVEGKVGRRVEPPHLLASDSVPPQEAVAAGLLRVELVEESALPDGSLRVHGERQIRDDVVVLGEEEVVQHAGTRDGDLHAVLQLALAVEQAQMDEKASPWKQ